MLNAILVNILWIILAYLIGSLNFSIILTKYSSKKINIKEVGSGNAGSTNAMRAYGWRFGLLVFFLDVSKSYWFGFTMGLLQSNTESFSELIPQLPLLFVIIGHIFPIYFKFKGGKGAATLLGMIASISIFLAAIGAVLFIILVWWTRYVSLGSIIIPYFVAAFAFVCPYFNHIDTTIIYGDFWLNPLFIFIGAIIVACSHWQNILRLIAGNENKISLSKVNKLFNRYKNDTSINPKNQDNKKISNTSIIDEATSLHDFDI